MQRIHGQSFVPKLKGEDSSSREWVHIEYKNERQIRTKDWTYTDEGTLTKVNEFGQPENDPEEQNGQSVVRDEMKKIFASIDGT